MKNRGVGRGWCIPILMAVVILILLKGVFLIGYVPTESMEPTIPKGSFVVGTRIFSEPKKGDIIIFRHDGKLLVKRIAAVGGEKVQHQDAILIVLEGRYYVLGDNAKSSADSRKWKEPFVEKHDIAAIALHH